MVLLKKITKWWIRSIESITPPKFDMEPKNEKLEDAFPSLLGDFQVPC